MTPRIQALLAHHLPGRSAAAVVRLGEGYDNVAYEVGDLVVRVSKADDPVERAEAVRREAALLTAVAGLTDVPVPEPVFVDPEAGAFAYRKLPGRPLHEDPALHRPTPGLGAPGFPVPDPARLGAVLGGFLGSLHRAPVDTMARLVPHDAEPLAAWLEEAAGNYGRVREHLTADARRRVEDFLAAPVPAEPTAFAFCHNDLGAEHILVDPDTGALTGVIDWTDAAIADPVYDLALLHRDLGPEVLAPVLAHYPGPACPSPACPSPADSGPGALGSGGPRPGGLDEGELERLRFYARATLLEDLAHGVETDSPTYTRAALAQFARVFDPTCQPGVV